MVIFLLYRYYNKKTRNTNISTQLNNADGIESFNEEEKKLINEILFKQTAHLNNWDTTQEEEINTGHTINNVNTQPKKKSFKEQLDDVNKESHFEPTLQQPSFNRLIPVNQQAQYVNYPPGPALINIPGVGTVDGKQYYPYPKQYQNLNAPQVNYDTVYNNKSLSYYSGTVSPYIDNQHGMNNVGQIVNPYGWPTNFNETTGNFVDQMTEANKQNVMDYQTLIDNLNNNLTENLKIGPDFLDQVKEIDPPYADIEF
jgi:hypothetical protein